MEEELPASVVQERIELDATEQRAGREGESNCRCRVRARRAAEPLSTARSRGRGREPERRRCHCRCQCPRSEERREGEQRGRIGGERVRGRQAARQGSDGAVATAASFLCAPGAGRTRARGPSRPTRPPGSRCTPSTGSGRGQFPSLDASDRGGRIARSARSLAIARHHHATARPCPPLGWPMIAALNLAGRRRRRRSVRAPMNAPGPAGRRS
ncbi:hypothetical protein PAHAL_7G319800 [Panicum hallii]|uniref:Uncharacterized protein n=1 Tax=Panicum hallii TaxID=206008 RepID=A0A2T8IE55_9POAL|nr:hypothetical protein PAHAL_7G319800 [Panicum hallii]